MAVEGSVCVKYFNRDVLFLHIAVMLFGLSGVVGRFVDLPATAVAGGRVIFSSILLLLLCLVTRTGLKLDSRRDYLLAVFAGIMLAIHWTSFFQSIQLSSVAIGTITFSTFPLFLIFLEPLLFRERFSLKNLVCAMILLAGVTITIPEFSMGNQVTVGLLWGMLSSFSYAIITLCNRYLSRSYAGSVVCLYEQGTAAVVLLPFLLGAQAVWTVQNVVGVGIIGIACTTLAYSLYVAAQKRLKAQTVGIISGMETVYGIVYALLFLKEVPTLRELLGGAVILSVALVFSLGNREEKAN